MKQPESETLVRDSYNQLVDRYVEEFLCELEKKPFDRHLLAEFAGEFGDNEPIYDVGCGPGHVGRFLCERGLRVTGLDLSPAMIEKARDLHPSMDFFCGSMLSLPMDAEGLSGIVAFYSLIHLVRSSVPAALVEFHRVLRPGGSLLFSVHAGEGDLLVDEMLGVSVPMVATLFSVQELRSLVEQSGLEVKKVLTRSPYDFEYPSERIYVWATKPDRRQRPSTP